MAAVVRDDAHSRAITLLLAPVCFTDPDPFDAHETNVNRHSLQYNFPHAAVTLLLTSIGRWLMVDGARRRTDCHAGVLLHLGASPSFDVSIAGHGLPVVMSEQADAGVGTKRTASPMSGLSPPAKRLTQDVKTDYEILTIAMRDIATVKAALASKTPVQSLRKATNLISAYKHFMYKGRTKYKGRTVQLVYRPWEKKPTSKVHDCPAIASCESFLYFVRLLQVRSAECRTLGKGCTASAKWWRSAATWIWSQRPPR